MYASEFPYGWEKEVKVVNLLAPTKKGSTSKSAKPKPTKKGGDASKIYSDIVLYQGGLPPIGNIVLESTPPLSARARSTRRLVAAQTRPPILRQPLDAPPSSKTHGSKRRRLPQPHCHY